MPSCFMHILDNNKKNISINFIVKTNRGLDAQRVRGKVGRHLPSWYSSKHKKSFSIPEGKKGKGRGQGKREDNINKPIYLKSEKTGKCLRIFSATETLAASINSSTIWFASLIWYIPVEITFNLL